MWKLHWGLTGGVQQQSPLHWRRRSTPLATHTALCRLKATSKDPDESAKGWAMPNIRTHFAYSDFPIDRCSVGSFADHLVDKREGLKWLADESDNVLWTARTITHAKNEHSCQGGQGGNPLECIVSLREISTFLHFYILHLLDLHTSQNSLAGRSLTSQATNREVKVRVGCDEIFLQPQSNAGRGGIAELGNSKERRGKDYISSCWGKKQRKGEKGRGCTDLRQNWLSWNVIYIPGHVDSIGRARYCNNRSFFSCLYEFQLSGFE